MIPFGRMVTTNLKKIIPLTASSRIRYITTSKKNQETATVAGHKVECQTQSNKPWVSYGFSNTDETEDRFALHAIMFFTITIAIVCNGFLMAYRPKDRFRDKDWIQREAFLELRRREKEGLPLIDPNFIPLDQIILPSDEELGDTEIII